MKKIIHLTSAVAFVAAASVASAQQDVSYYQHHGDTALYTGNELSFDAFGTDALSQQTLDHLSTHRINHSSRLGVGVGINYFLTPYIGVGGEAYTENTDNRFVDDADGNLIVRIPIGQTGLAPYGFGGAGYKWDPVPAVYGQAGAGLEFRFTHNIGIFADGRWVFIEKINNYGLFRAGVRFAF